jgi:hypothetical protein
MKARERKLKQTRNGRTVRKEPAPTYRNQVNTLGLGFPDVLRTSLRYTDTINLTSASYGSVLSFRGNSVYDPDSSGVGHSPYYYATLAQVYSKYKVYGSKITCYVQSTLSNSTGLALIPTTEPLSAPTSQYEILDLPRAEWRLIPAVNINTKIVAHNASTSQILGLTQRQVEDNDYSSAINTNPAQQWFWNLYGFNVLSSVLQVDLSIVVQIEYDVKFYDRVDIGSTFNLNTVTVKPVSRTIQTVISPNPKQRSL